MTTRSITLRLLMLPLVVSLVGGCDDGTSPGGPVSPNGPTNPDASTTGAMRVTAVTSGSPVDSDGYMVTVGQEAPQALRANGALTYTDLDASGYAVKLTGVASNCLVSGANPRTVAVVAGDTASAEFLVRCYTLTGATTGAIAVRTLTIGASLDADGYELSIEGKEPQAIPIDADETISKLDPGDYDVELTGVASNCGVGGANPRMVSVVVGEAASTTFDITCTFVQRPMAFSTDRDGNIEIYAMNADGSDPVRLTDDPAVDEQPDWSPDGAKIVFTAGAEAGGGLRVMDAGGSTATQLTDGDDIEPAWSSDGTKIAFTRLDETGWDWDPGIYVMSAVGGDPVRIDTLTAGQAAWSPDGSRIAFTGGTVGGGVSDIYVIGADGTNETNLTNDSAVVSFDPAWSPDGTRIAFRRGNGEGSDVWVMAVDGSNQVNLTNYAAYDGEPAWSPDGTKIAFDLQRIDALARRKRPNALRVHSLTGLPPPRWS